MLPIFHNPENFIGSLIRARNKLGEIGKLKTTAVFHSDDDARRFLKSFFPQLELVDWEDWNEGKHGGGILSPVAGKYYRLTGEVLRDPPKRVIVPGHDLFSNRLIPKPIT